MLTQLYNKYHWVLVTTSREACNSPYIFFFFGKRSTWLVEHQLPFFYDFDAIHQKQPNLEEIVDETQASRPNVSLGSFKNITNIMAKHDIQMVPKASRKLLKVLGSSSGRSRREGEVWYLWNSMPNVLSSLLWTDKTENWGTFQGAYVDGNN
jgi:hypothetical protein